MKKFGLIAGFLSFIFLLNFDLIINNPEASKLTAVIALMVILWLTEALPLGITALLPVFLFPLLGIMDAGKVSGSYMNSTIFLYIGGFFLGLALERWNLQKRIALLVINAFGVHQTGIVAGFLFAAAFISMFVNNTATCIMMMPIGLAIILKVEELYGGQKNTHNFSTPLMIGIAYGSSIGGIATLIGTAPNMIFHRIFKITFPTGPEINFSNWLLFGLPMCLLMLCAAVGLFYLFFLRKSTHFKIDKHLIKKELSVNSKMSYEEKIVSVIFAFTCCLWIFRNPMELGSFYLPGWSSFLPYGNYIEDGTIAIFTSFILFIIPTKNKKEYKTIIDLGVIYNIPWDIIFLFGGGFALAEGFQRTGLSIIIGQQLEFMSGISPILMILIICTILTFLTELTSNTAVTQTLLPIIATLSIVMGINPLLLMIPATISASFAFMLPVGTPPNAIVFGSGRIKITEMVKTGLYLNFIGIIVVTLVFYFAGTMIFDINPSEMPFWAK